MDCDDGSDEKECDFPLHSCPEGEFKCRGMLGGMGGPGARCILDRYHCDGDNDCGDWSDEGKELFFLPGTIIYAFNDYVENCPKKLIPCSTTEFKCDDGRCIPLRWRCDSEQDCDSGEDEKDCSDIGPPNRECSDDEYMCKDSRCISKNWVCDGHADCKRGEDEMECVTKCEIGQFSCPSKPTTSAIARDQRRDFCVSQKHICDGHKDCNNGEDELNCSTPSICPPNTRCKQLCAKSASGKDECACSIGYILSSDGISCEDINECEFINNPCSQTCNNTLGGFT
jgi:low-density lipoprotein receptor-related protein 4